MESLSIADTKLLLQGVQQLYTEHDCFATTALQVIESLVPSDFPEFHVTQLSERSIEFVGLPDRPRNFEQSQAIAQQHFWEHPILRHAPQSLTGVHKISDFVTQEEFHKLEGLYQKVLRPFEIEDQMTLFFTNTNLFNHSYGLAPERNVAGFSLSRRQRNFTERDRLVLELLRPYLQHSYRYSHGWQAVKNCLNSLDILPIILLDRQNHVNFITSATVKLLQDYDLDVSDSKTLPDILKNWVQFQIQRQHENAFDFPKPFPPLRIQRSNGTLIIDLLIDPSEQCTLLLREEKGLTIEQIQSLGLSPREASILSAVIHGKDNPAIAQLFNIQIGTVRKHLENIYSKLKVKSRSEAIAHVLSIFGRLDVS